jgi:hypothetical protein
MNLIIANIVFIIFLMACVGSPLHISMMSSEELSHQDSYLLCNAYALKRSKNIKTELLKRNIIPPKEWQPIDQGEIKRGMSELGLICSWGYPTINGSINETVGSWGVHKQWVYRLCSTCSSQYVYTENGKITGWQN